LRGGLVQMLKGGVIMDVVNAEQARIAEEAGAVAVMALERVPADIRADGGVARMSDPGMIKEIMAAVTIPVMAKVRIGHFVEAQIIEAVGVDYIDESEVLTPADEELHINKHKFKVRKSAATAAHSHFGSLLRQELVLSSCCSCVPDVTQVPFVCGCRNLGEALRRIDEGASMIRTKGEAGTGNVVEAVRHARAVHREIKQLCSMDEDELFMFGAACPPLPARPPARLPAAAALRPHACAAGSPLRPLRSQADWRFVRAGQEDQGDGPSSGCQLCCRRCRNAG
jgi:pyridoxal 5'-phosphate synthase pdxS subunit